MKIKACRPGDERRALLRELPPRGFTLSSHPSQDGWCALRREGPPGGFTLRSPARVAAPGGALFPLGRAKWSSCRSAFDSPAVRGQAHPGHPLPERALPGRVSPIMPVPGRVIARPSRLIVIRCKRREKALHIGFEGLARRPPVSRTQVRARMITSLATRVGRVKGHRGTRCFPRARAKGPAHWPSGSRQVGPSSRTQVRACMPHLRSPPA